MAILHLRSQSCASTILELGLTENTSSALALQLLSVWLSLSGLQSMIHIQPNVNQLGGRSEQGSTQTAASF